MGRNKITIKGLPSLPERKAKYALRIKGLVKKAKELSTMCDVPHLLLTFSPSGEPTVSTQNGTFEEILTAYSNLNPEKRLKSKEESLKKLGESLEKAGEVIDVSQFANHSAQVIESNEQNEDKKAKLKNIQDEISKIENFLGPLSLIDDIDQINSMEKIVEMENCLLQLLQQNELSKAFFVEQGMALNGFNTQQ
ncbi:hypothetical protein LUZ61_009620 [Rhynchospora tenuis]|uniref:MADS-box domain-containing protein n=1 Tax=Rhynchospora tenuis TaxID=198213 RepID=A0AAD5ZXM3_9POAL|nr:hypothetical protein LUZ61_009620 [Rhynchospora tenuis]